MITKLTKAQKAKFPEFVDKWLKIGLCIERVNRDTAKWISDYFYREIADKKPVPVVVISSPLYTWYAVCLFIGGGQQVWQQVWQQVRQQVSKQVWQQVWQQVGQQVWQQVSKQVEQQVEQQVGQQVWKQVWQQVEHQVEQQVEQQVGQQVRQQVEQQVRQQVRQQVSKQVWQQVEQQVRQQVRQQVGQQVGQQVRQQVEQQVRHFVYPYFDGQLISSYFAFYNFINEVLGIKYTVQDKYNWYQKTSEVGLIYPLENICVISDRPSEICMKNGLLHSENSAAISYTDGFSVYCLNGIRMKPEYVLTPADKIPIESVLKEENVDVRRELLRKVGIKRFKEQGKVLEIWNGYELLDMSNLFSGLRNVKYLYMKNPSVSDTFHLEAVPRECDTIEKALNARKPPTMRNIPVSKDGENWYQQGDVCIWPENALMLKEYPTILT